MAQRETLTSPPRADFFISYSPADEAWATWIAWELERAGFRTMVQAWDFLPGTNFIDFMDRGVSQATAVIAVLSRNYLQSRWGRWEWQTAIRADPDDPSRKLITVLIEDCPLEGLLATITYVNLVGLTDPAQARSVLLEKVRQTLAGRAKPPGQPDYPAGARIAAVSPGGVPGGSPAVRPAGQPRRTLPAPPVFPSARGAAPVSRPAVTLLHVAGPRFGRAPAGSGDPAGAAELQARIWASITHQARGGVPRPELLVVSGDLTESGSLRQFDEAVTFLAGLRALLGLSAERLVIVPGGHDVTRLGCQAYFATCEADDVLPQSPYWPKWRHYAPAFDELYRGLDATVFDPSQPWTLFTVPDLGVAVAGLNSTIADSHRPEDHYGWIGVAQAAWFAERLRPYEESGWLRLGVIRHPLAVGGAAPAAGALRDGNTLERLLGPLFNLLLHGPGGPAAARSDGPGGLVTVPAPGPGDHDIIQVTPAGLTRWRAGQAGNEPERVQRRWHAVGGTFSDSGDSGDERPRAEEPLVAAAGEPAPVAERDYSPVSQLLDRIAEVLAAGHPGAKIRRMPGEPPHLLVTHSDDGFFRQWRVAAHVGEVTRDDIEAFVAQLHAGEPETGSEFVYEGPRPAQVLAADALRRGVRLRSFMEFQGLLDLRDYVAGQAMRLREDRLYQPGLYVPQRFRELGQPEALVREDIVAELLRQLAADHGRFILVLGDFGRGKTFALRELARHIPVRLPHLIPILIELRELDKAHTVDGLVAAHLANHGEEVIDLKAFRYMLRQGRIVLLFDGFDELVTRVTYDRAADHLETLLRAAEDKAKIVVASRTQHFKSDAQVLTALGERVELLPQRRVLDLQDFTADQIRAYLVNRYSGEKEADDRLDLMGGVEDLLGLSHNPRMLSFIADLPPERLRAVADAGRTMSAATLYQAILQSWLQFEERRIGGLPGMPAGLSVADLWHAVRTLAMRLWESGEALVRLDELTDQAAMSLTGLAGGQLSPLQTAHALGTGTLLVRTEEGLFGFIHSSVGEWLVASEIAAQLNAGTADPVPLSHRVLSQLTVDFLCDLAAPRECQQWVERMLADAGAGKVPRANALKVAARMRTPSRTNLRGASLQGEDLSHRTLQQVDLTGADLTDARLVGTNLAGAILAGARLCGARLDQAKLTGADLRGADLSRARLVGADLRGVALAGSRWRRAAVINVTADPDFAAAPELRGAAVSPGQRVETELAPAVIGVPYGYHFETARLPEPLAYSRDGSVLAIGNEDGGLLLIDTGSGQPLRTLRGHRGRVYAVAYGATDDVIVTGGSDGMLRVWDPSAGRCVQTVDFHADGVWPVAVSPDGSLVAAGTKDGIIHLLDLANGETRHELGGHGALVYTAAFNRSGTLLATGDAAGTVRLWDMTTGAVARRLRVQGSPAYRLAFSPDETRLACGGPTGTVWVWDTATGELTHELTGHHGRVYTLDFHPTMPLLASGDTDGNICLWDLAADELRQALRGRRVYRVLFSPEGDFLVSADSDGAVRLWDPVSGQMRHELAGHKSSVWPPVFRPDGDQLATTSNDGTIRLWDTATGQSRQVIRGHGRRVMSAAFSADGARLATASSDGIVRLWDPVTGQRQRELAGVADQLLSAVFSPLSSLLATAGNGGSVHLWDGATGSYQREMNVETDHVWAEAFGPDGDVIATANDDDSVRLWYRTTGRNVLTLSAHRGRVRSVAFRPDGNVVATGCDDRVARLWDASDGTLRASLPGHTDRIYAVAFSPDGQTLASASNDGTVRLWDPENGKLLTRLAPGSGQLWTAAFSPDGTMLAAAGDDGRVTIWDPASGGRLHSLVAHSRKVTAIVFSPDGRLLASVGDDGLIRLWALGGDGASGGGGAGPALRATLLGLPEGWAAFAPDGAYKFEGVLAGQFWHVISMCRFEPGELDDHLAPAVRRLPPDAPF